MVRQELKTIRIEKELDNKLRNLALKEQRTKLDELRFLINQREQEINGGPAQET